MNEVRGNSPVGVVPARAASSKVEDTVGASTQKGGKDLPEARNVGLSQEEVRAGASIEKIEEAVAQMNDFLQNEQRDLHFSVDEGSGSTVVKVLDRESGDLIRQIPNETFLKLAESAKEFEAIHLINVQG